MTPNKMMDAALQYASRGWHVFPIVAGKKTPKTPNGFYDATIDEAAIRSTWDGKPFLNVGVAAGAVSGVWFLDIDGEPGAMSIMDLEAEHGSLPETLTFRTPRGGRQHVFRVPDGVSIPSHVGLLPGIDTRGDGGYSVVPPSTRPEGAYSFIDPDIPVADAPGWLIRLVTTAKPSSAEVNVDAMTIEATSFKEHPGAVEPGRNATAARLAGCELARGSAPSAVLADALAWASRCRPPMDLDELRDVLTSIAGRESAKPEAIADDDDDAFDAIPLPARQWPARPSVILSHGVIGDLLNRVEEETEADPVAIATTFLVALGSVVGRGPHFMVGAKAHHANLFATIVGGTGEGRKGTSMSIVRAIMRGIDQKWASDCHTSALSSGEGLIDLVRDEVWKPQLDKKTGAIEMVLAEPGVTDKRLLCEIEEMAAAMRAGKSDRSILFPVLRDAWDGNDLRNPTKNSPRRATEPHVSAVFHVTPEELLKLQTDCDIFGGTWNRLIWIAAKRARYCPHGGDFDDLRDLQDRVRSVVTHGSNVGRMRRTESADRLWEAEYYRRAEARMGGVVGAILGRADAQLVRLSMLAALCRCEAWVDEVDLAAALDLWRYCEASVRLFFSSGEDPLISKIIAAVNESPGISRRMLRRTVAKTMRAAAFLDKLAQAAATGAISHEVRQTGGRPSECWSPRAIRRQEENPQKTFGTSGPSVPASETKTAVSSVTQTPTIGSPSSSSKHGRTL